MTAIAPSVAAWIAESDAFTVEMHDDRDAWLEGRATGIGGSDAPALWGVPSYASPLSLYHGMRGLAPDREESEAMEIGSEIEPVAARLYAKRTGRDIIDLGRFTRLRSRRWPWMTVTVDRLVVGELRATYGVLECKNRGVGAAANWKEALPLDVQIQVQHALAVTGYGWGSGAAILGGNRFVWADLERDEAWIEMHVERCERFVRAVEAGEEPGTGDPEAAERDAATLAQLYPFARLKKTTDLPADLAAWAQVYEDCGREIDLLEKTRKAARNRFARVMKDAEVGILPNGDRWSLKTVKREAFSVEETSYRQLRKMKGNGQ